jgi:hypothetical protein
LEWTTRVPAIAWYAIRLPPTVTEPVVLTSVGLNSGCTGDCASPFFAASVEGF